MLTRLLIFIAGLPLPDRVRFSSMGIAARLIERRMVALGEMRKGGWR